MDEITEPTEITNTANRKVAVITGASSGIGRATALEFAKQGYNVVLAARREDLLDEVAAECELEGVLAESVATNITDEAEVRDIARIAVETFGRIDVWVNNAGVSLYGKFEDLPSDEFLQVIDTNLFGYVYGARSALKQFKEQGHGTLINISSVNAVAPQPYSSAYNASKSAIRSLSHSLRMELELDGLSDMIHVCNVMPASHDTNLFQNAGNHTQREIRALEPVYDPTYAAKHIVKLAETPRREIIIGPAGKLMAMEYALAPNWYERTMSRFVDRNHLGELQAADTIGNLYEPIMKNNDMRGGWRETRLRADTVNTAIGLAAAGVVALVGLGWYYTRQNPET